MIIRSISHKGLRRLVEDGKSSGVPARATVKIEAIVAFLTFAEDAKTIRRLHSWKAHQLTGDRKGVWSISVTRNWRITFEVNADNEIENLNFEDYH